MGMNVQDGMQVVEAEDPMAEMSSYAIDLRSMTQAGVPLPLNSCVMRKHPRSFSRRS
jgi:translation elongation factor EF-G